MYNETNHMYEEELRKDRYESMYKNLQEYDADGINILVRGKHFPLTTCAKIMTINEGEFYMPDMIEDAHGKVVEINFDLIEHF